MFNYPGQLCPIRDRALKVGMIASIHVQQADAQKVPLVPVTALITAQSGSSNYSVFTLSERDGKQFAQLQSVRVGETIGRSVVISEGLHTWRSNYYQPDKPAKRWKPGPGSRLGDTQMTHESKDQPIQKTSNLARFFTEQRQVAWVCLVVALLWGIYGLSQMPQRKDPDIPVRQAMIIVPWQGTSAEQVEQLVTKKVEQAIALNQWVTEIKSASRTGSSMIQFELAEKGKYDRDKELDDVKIRLDAIHDLPQGAGPIHVHQGFRRHVGINADRGESSGRPSPSCLDEQTG